MTTKKNTDVAEVEETEAAAIPVYDKAPTHSRKPKYFVAGDTFYTQTPDGELRIPLRFKTKLLRAIRDSGDELDQLFALLAGLGDADTAAALDELDIFDTTEIAEKYFQAWQEKNEARLGELSRSSNS